MQRVEAARIGINQKSTNAKKRKYGIYEKAKYLGTSRCFPNDVPPITTHKFPSS
jgi:hypothetical protein